MPPLAVFPTNCRKKISSLEHNNRRILMAGCLLMGLVLFPSPGLFAQSTAKAAGLGQVTFHIASQTDSTALDSVWVTLQGINHSHSYSGYTDSSGTLILTDVYTPVQEQATPPETFALSPAMPNPSRNTTRLLVDLPRVQDVQMAVYNVLGQRVATLQRSRLAAGTYQAAISLDGLSAGLYFVRVRAGKEVRIAKIMYLGSGGGQPAITLGRAPSSRRFGKSAAPFSDISAAVYKLTLEKPGWIPIKKYVKVTSDSLFVYKMEQDLPPVVTFIFPPEPGMSFDNSDDPIFLQFSVEDPNKEQDVKVEFYINGTRSYIIPETVRGSATLMRWFDLKDYIGENTFKVIASDGYNETIQLQPFRVEPRLDIELSIAYRSPEGISGVLPAEAFRLRAAGFDTIATTDINGVIRLDDVDMTPLTLVVEAAQQNTVVKPFRQTYSIKQGEDIQDTLRVELYKYFSTADIVLLEGVTDEPLSVPIYDEAGKLLATTDANGRASIQLRAGPQTIFFRDTTQIHEVIFRPNLANHFQDIQVTLYALDRHEFPMGYLIKFQHVGIRETKVDSIVTPAQAGDYAYITFWADTLLNEKSELPLWYINPPDSLLRNFGKKIPAWPVLTEHAKNLNYWAALVTKGKPRTIQIPLPDSTGTDKNVYREEVNSLDEEGALKRNLYNDNPGNIRAFWLLAKYIGTGNAYNARDGPNGPWEATKGYVYTSNELIASTDFSEVFEWLVHLGGETRTRGLASTFFSGGSVNDGLVFKAPYRGQEYSVEAKFIRAKFSYPPGTKILTETPGRYKDLGIKQNPETKKYEPQGIKTVDPGIFNIIYPVTPITTGGPQRF